jgi:hypothetical protein
VTDLTPAEQRFVEVHGYDPRVPMAVRVVMRGVFTDQGVDRWWFEHTIHPEGKTPGELFETMSAKEFIGLLDDVLSPGFT